MPFEVTCGECSGHLLVDQGGIVVECPLCGAHLTIPDVMPEGEEVPSVVAETTTADSQILADVAATPEATSAANVAEVMHVAADAAAPETANTASAVFEETPESDDPSENLPSPEATEVSMGITESSDALAEDTAATLANSPFYWASHSHPDLTALVAQTPTRDAALPTSEPEPASDSPVSVPSGSIAPAASPAMPAPLAEIAALSVNALPSPVSVPSPDPALLTPALAKPPVSSATQAAPSPVAPETVPKQLFILVAGYASAVTLAFVALLWTYLNSRAHILESLPDLVPEIRKDGVVGMPRVLPEMDLPPGHELKLGQTERFGNIRLTPVKITRGPLQFVHAYGNKQARQDPTGPVLKLWLKFENVSSTQEFPPLDRTLVYRRMFDKRRGATFALNFLTPADKRHDKDGERFFIYDHPEFSEFLLQNQNVDHWLAAGETWETYIPAEEAVDQLKGEWVWRVLFRKGLNARSGRGVTTLVDVHFDADDVTTEG